MNTRFDLLPLALICGLLALAACSHENNRAGRPVTPPPFLIGAKGPGDEPTGAIEAGKDAAHGAGGEIDANQRLAALELDMAAIKIELSRVSEFDRRLAALEGGSPHSASKLEPALSYDEPAPAKLKVPGHAADAPLPVPAGSSKKGAALLPSDDQVPASVAALEPVAPAAPAIKTVAPGKAPDAAPAVSTASGDFGIQLASYGSAAGTAKGWSSLSAQAGVLLSGLSPKREEANVAGKTVYRLKAGPFADAASAKQRCAGLQAAGHACLVTGFTGSWP